jgi:hypothetical protein
MRDSEALGVNPHCRCAFGLVTARRAVATEWTPSAALVADGAEDSDASSRRKHNLGPQDLSF